MTAADALAEWGFLGRRVLVVSPFPPAEDGIATYADQLVHALQGERQFVRLALPGGHGDHIRRLYGGPRPLWILWHARGVDDVLVMYHPDYYVQGGAVGRLSAHLALMLLSRLRRTTFVVHEPEHPLPEPIGRRGRLEFRALELVRRWLWRGVSGLVFHTEWERRRFVARFPGAPKRAEHLVTHGAFFSSAVAQVPREAARERLGLRAEPLILLCIGFLSPEKPDKGYDRAMRAVGEAAHPAVELHVVGSPIRRPVPEVAQYVQHLRDLAQRTPGVTLHERYVSDEEFDLWIRAADAVVVPYRAASSSGVVARSRLLGTRLIASAVGGIAAQLGPEDITFDSDGELVDAIRALAGQASV
jgi:glycosyltransferase involved in cell wall biosynthesis